MKNIVVIFAGGAGQRMNSGTRPKQFLELHGKPIIIYTLEQFDRHPMIDGIVVVCLESWIPFCEELITRFGIDTKVEPSVVTSTYNSHTQAAIDSGCKEVALAAMLPCMWIYNEVGLYILSIASLEGNPYREWVMEYGNEEFTEGVNAVLALADGWAAAADDATRAGMTRAYLEAALFEYAFWDYGYSGPEKDYSYMNSLKEWL